MQELAVIKQFNLPICIIILNNGGYCSIRNTQKNYFNERYLGVGPKSDLLLPNLKKIAAIGIRVRKWIAYHGFSLNVCNDLSKYNGIIPCGVKDKGITNLKKLGITKFNNIEEIIIKKFLNFFL